jgi:hypothetical protein
MYEQDVGLLALDAARYAASEFALIFDAVNSLSASHPR